MPNQLKLGVNIDHVATLRNARFVGMLDSPYAEPSPVTAALEAEAAGADSITAHLREDRRHIVDRDIAELRERIGTKLNFEMGNTPEIVEIALATKPAFVCLVPEHRAEVTTEGGLDVAGNRDSLKPTIDRLQQAGIQVSLFIDPVEEHIAASAELGAEMVELHTGAYANASGDARQTEADRLAEGARQSHAAGLQVNAGHGITTTNLPGLFGVPHLIELNIGHHLIARSFSIGLGAAIKEMREIMAQYP
ncbi:MAG: pyridoxine 5-phosphate synthase [Verrucomicrobiales bacterium]|jgi:pyridoxine 5-phosphate synthase